ncbi:MULTISPECIES: response regulator [unclassified Bradyrhizobium]|uniref:response regulator n=1 Tax=unclassified Bradyrhizobium TaxID=2631580 RepID=UPI001C64C28D|nr:response regulator [Bradyrhizobium sp. BR 10261]MBW7963598.1 response regulator [Bradyrhizobium sp. BR 10261]
MQLEDASKWPVVLVVEDDELLRWSTMIVLQDSGYSVLEASDAGEALTTLEQRADVRIIFTDVQMPGAIDGVRLAHLVSQRWPLLKIIVTSGRMRLHQDDLPKGGVYLMKPYSATELTTAVYEVRAGG